MLRTKSCGLSSVVQGEEGFRVLLLYIFSNFSALAHNVHCTQCVCVCACVRVHARMRVIVRVMISESLISTSGIVMVVRTHVLPLFSSFPPPLLIQNIGEIFA